MVQAEGTVKDRTRQALKNLTAVLEASGSSLRNVVKVNVYITQMADFATMNEAYDEFFTFDPKPVSFLFLSCLEMTLLVVPGRS